MENKINLKDISKHYETFSLKEISFSVPKGYVVGFIGKNGSGKTTTIKAILSMIALDGGEIFYDDKKIENRDYLQDIGVIMDDSFLAKDWTMDLVNKAMSIGYDKWESDKFFAYLKDFSIDRNLKVSELSKGMKIKLMLAIALSHQAKLLILDEPTSGLDPNMRDEFTDIIKGFVEDEDHTVLFSTHITQDLEAIADYIVFIDDGRLVDFLPKDDFLEKYLILKGDLEDLKKIDEKLIVGRKNSSLSFEILIERKNYKEIQGLGIEIYEEVPTIDRIMILYGRKN